MSFSIEFEEKEELKRCPICSEMKKARFFHFYKGQLICSSCFLDLKVRQHQSDRAYERGIR